MDRRNFLKSSLKMVAALPFAKSLLPGVEPLGQSLDIQPKLVEGQGEVVVVSTPTYADKVMEYEPIIYAPLDNRAMIRINNVFVPYLNYELTLDEGEQIPVYVPVPDSWTEFKIVDHVIRDQEWRLEMDLTLETLERIWEEVRLIPVKVSICENGTEFLAFSDNHSYSLEDCDKNVVKVCITGTAFDIREV